MEITPSGVATAVVNRHIQMLKKKMQAAAVRTRYDCAKELKRILNRNGNLNKMVRMSKYTEETLVTKLYGR